MVRKIFNFLIVACVIVGIYKVFGGDLSSFLTSGGQVLMNIVDAGSDIIVQLWEFIFG